MIESDLTTDNHIFEKCEEIKYVLPLAKSVYALTMHRLLQSMLQLMKLKCKTKLIQIHLRSTTYGSRLELLMILCIEKYFVDIDLNNVVNHVVMLKNQKI